MTGDGLHDLDIANHPQRDVVDAERLALFAAATAPTDWRSLPSAARSQSWMELRNWVVWLRREFGLDQRAVPPCWYRHAALVNVLSALHDHWRFAYDPLNSLLGPSDWHRAFMQLEQRLRDWASRAGCTPRVHRPDVVLDYPDDEVEWIAHVAADFAARTASEAVSGGRGDDHG